MTNSKLVLAIGLAAATLVVFCDHSNKKKRRVAKMTVTTITTKRMKGLHRIMNF